MRYIFFFGLVVLLGVSLMAQEKTTQVIIFAGQSNLNGTTSRSYYEASMRREEVQYAWLMTLFDWSRRNSGDFTPLDRRLFQGKERYACELSAGGMIADSIEDDVVVLLVNRSGSSIHKEWDPRVPLDPTPNNPSQAGAMLSYLVKFTQEKVAKLEEPGKVEYSLIWHQGESDAKPGELSEAYYERFSQFYDSLRQHISPDIKVFPIKIYNPKHEQKDVVVNAAFERVAEENKQVTFLEVDDLWNSVEPKNSLDEQHWSAIGYLNLGNRVAEEWLKSYYREDKSQLFCDELGNLTLPEDLSLFVLPTLSDLDRSVFSSLPNAIRDYKKFTGTVSGSRELFSHRENFPTAFLEEPNQELLNSLSIETFACIQGSNVFLLEKVRSEVKVYPNPFQQRIRVEGEKGEKVEIYDLMGQLQSSGILSERGILEVDLKGPEGVYMVKTGGEVIRVYKE